MEIKEHPVTLAQHQDLAAAARRRGDLAAAQAHVAAALALDPERRVVGLSVLQAECLADTGDIAGAETVLQDAHAAHPDNLWPRYHLAVLARRRGDLAAAQAHVAAALALDPERRVVGLSVLQAECLADTGDIAGAEAVLQAARAVHPGNLWPRYHLAELARRRGDLAAAQAHVAAALALDPERRVVGLPVLLADCLADTGDIAGAEAVLQAARAAHPDNTTIIGKIVRLAHRQGQARRVQDLLETAARDNPGDRGLGLLLAEQRIQDKAFSAAIAGLQALRDRHGPEPQIQLLLARAHRGCEQLEREVDCLLAAIEAHPRDPNLLRHIFLTYPRMGTLEEVAEGLKLVRERVTEELADELEIAMLLQTMQFHKALPAIRRRRKARRSLSEAHKLIWALFGAHRYRLGMRYARFCLRRWPNDPALWSTYVRQGLRQGLLSEMARVIEAGEGALPEPVVVAQRQALCGYREDFAGAVACYARLQELGQVAPEQQELQTMLMFNLCDPEAADALFARIGHPSAADSRLPHRGGLPGMMTMEFDLERQALSEAGGYASLADWVRARPGSSMAAIRLIDAWRADTRAAPPDPSQAAEVPRRIFQYWDTPEVPGPIRPMIESWARAPGFTHQVMNRAAGVKFLRETLGPAWVRAFQMAHSAAEESDLLRLCLLARFGGIYADADDYLHGDLDRVLGPARGLILYRESLGGALGNNFMAAPPGHPVIVYAARQARLALAQRSVELAWTRTGPGLLTRAVAQYLLRTDPAEARRRLTVLDWARFGCEVSSHNPALYKTSSAYWGNAAARRPELKLWKPLLTALRGAG